MIFTKGNIPVVLCAYHVEEILMKQSGEKNSLFRQEVIQV